MSSTGTSPFGKLVEKENWSIWQKHPSVLEIGELRHADLQSVSSHEAGNITDSGMHAALQCNTIQRPQYNAVLKRFEQVNKVAPQFAKWKI